MGSGKSTVARALAHRLGWGRVDLDRAIAERAGTTIPEIFASEGEAGFRDWEERTLTEVAHRVEPLVVATGGGVVVREGNRVRMREAGAMVYLHADVDTLLARTRGDSNRPLLQVADPRGKLVELQAEREPLYREADHVEETAGRGPEAVAQALATWITERFPDAAPPGTEGRQ
jgi:shikimate kinase